MSPTPGNIVLVGFMGAGKTEVGRRLAERTGLTFIDTDELVETDGKTTVADIFASEGEKGFRERERRAVERAVRTRRAVIATGGGAVLDPANVKALRGSGVVVYLKVEPDELVQRLKDAGSRPLLRTGEGPMDPPGLRRRIERLLAERTPLYESVADHVVACADLGADETAEAIVGRLRPNAGPAPKVRTVRVAVDPPYNVRVGRGALGRLRSLLRLPKGCERIAIVSHPRIRRLWGTVVEGGLADGRLQGWFTFAEGEERKTVATAERLQRFLATSGFHRSDVVLALGGGVVGDVTGYVASTYARGIGYVQLPTTLLAMVDASIGGKTGVNLPQGKNLVGSFHQPLAVVADTDVLATLPDRELRAGLAEVIKTAFVADPSLQRYVVRHRDEIFARGDCLETIVLRCARAKGRVVAADEREETGLRVILNYGHTFGHALEAASGRLKGAPRSMHHGEAVAVGMVFAAEVAERLGRARGGLADEHRRVLEAVGLPTQAPGIPWEDVRAFMAMDKKHRGGLRMVLLEAPGKPVTEAVRDDALRAAYEAVSG